MKKFLYSLVVLMVLPLLVTGCNDKQEVKNTSNGANTTAQADNQAVYKVIDFNSYEGDTTSTSFNDLVGKKVTFTNIPVLAGYLGNLLKNFDCVGSTFTLEDGKTYTLTGVVKNVTGTYLVSLTNCVLTAN